MTLAVAIAFIEICVLGWIAAFEHERDIRGLDDERETPSCVVEC